MFSEKINFKYFKLILSLQEFGARPVEKRTHGSDGDGVRTPPDPPPGSAPCRTPCTGKRLCPLLIFNGNVFSFN